MKTNSFFGLSTPSAQSVQGRRPHFPTQRRSLSQSSNTYDSLGEAYMWTTVTNLRPLPLSKIPCAEPKEPQCRQDASETQRTLTRSRRGQWPGGTAFDRLAYSERCAHHLCVSGRGCLSATSKGGSDTADTARGFYANTSAKTGRITPTSRASKPESPASSTCSSSSGIFAEIFDSWPSRRPPAIPRPQHTTS